MASSEPSNRNVESSSIAQMEARALYLKYRGTTKVEGEKSWEAVILEDFAELRKAGLSNPLMGRDREQVQHERMSVTTSLNNLAVLYYRQGRYADAESHRTAGWIRRLNGCIFLRAPSSIAARVLVQQQAAHARANPHCARGETSACLGM